MKKAKLIAITIALCSAVSLIGCGNKTARKPSINESPISKETKKEVETSVFTEEITTATTTNITTTDIDTTIPDIQNESNEYNLVPIVDINISSETDFSNVIINGTRINILNNDLQSVLNDAEIKHCPYGSTSLSDDFDFASGMFGIQSDETNPASFVGTQVSIEVIDENGNLVNAHDLDSNLFSEYRIKGIRASNFFTEDDFEIIFYDEIKCGMTKDELIEILGAGTESDGKILYNNGVQTLVIGTKMKNTDIIVDEITLLNN